jgi:hypothetical protein
LGLFLRHEKKKETFFSERNVKITIRYELIFGSCTYENEQNNKGGDRVVTRDEIARGFPFARLIAGAIGLFPRERVES